MQYDFRLGFAVSEKNCTLSHIFFFVKPTYVVLYFVFPGELYVSDKQGSDQDGDGTQQKPFKTALNVTLISSPL